MDLARQEGNQSSSFIPLLLGKFPLPIPLKHCINDFDRRHMKSGVTHFFDGFGQVEKIEFCGALQDREEPNNGNVEAASLFDGAAIIRQQSIGF